MTESTVVELFEWLDETTMKFHEVLDEPYLDSLAMTLETLFHEEVQQDVGEDVKTTLQRALESIDLTNYTTTEIRKAIQLAILKGMKEGTQAHHAMTPEAISLFVAYLAEKLTAHLEEIRLFDPASGTGNLLLTVMEQLSKKVTAYASEIDPTLIKLALYQANLQQKEVEYFHQDSLAPFLLDPVDLVVSDIPVGYYPDDERAKAFELKAEEGHSYAHHLFIEQSVTYTKPGGFLILLIPEFLFESDQKDQLQAYLHKHTHIIGLLQLPDSAFKAKQNKKSIFMLRKKGEGTKDVKQPLLAMLPSFSSTTAMEDIVLQINEWFEKVRFD